MHAALRELAENADVVEQSLGVQLALSSGHIVVGVIAPAEQFVPRSRQATLEQLQPARTGWRRAAQPGALEEWAGDANPFFSVIDRADATGTLTLVDATLTGPAVSIAVPSLRVAIDSVVAWWLVSEVPS